MSLARRVSRLPWLQGRTAVTLVLIGLPAHAVSSPWTNSARSATAVASLSITPTDIPAGQKALATVTLDQISLIDANVQLASSQPGVASVPAELNLRGRISGQFNVGAQTVVGGCSTISARVGKTPAKSRTVFVLPAATPAGSAVRLALDGTATVVGGTVGAQIVLPQVAPPGGVTVSLAASNAGATVPASVLIPPGQTAQRFQVQLAAATQEACVVVSATYAGFTSRGLIKILQPFG